MSTVIDTINSKILKDLLIDGRKSFVEIAKECSTSKDVIAKRYKQMENKGIIVGATTQNSLACYNSNIVASINVRIEPNKIEQVTNLARKIPKVLNIYPSVGNQSLGLHVILKNMEELEYVKQSIKNLPFVSGIDVAIWIGIRSSPYNLSILDTKENFLENKERSIGRKSAKVDEINEKIIKKLTVNGRIPFQRIAKELKLSTDTVIRRYNQLKQNRDLNVVIQIDPTKIGYVAFAIINIAFLQENIQESMQALFKIQDINFIIKTSGNFDYMMSLMIRDILQLIEVQEQIFKIPGFSSMQIIIGKMFNVWPTPREFISTF
jgi:Lrp/AsnC family transcriptional regulator for asnA, asnC and gidA